MIKFIKNLFSSKRDTGPWIVYKMVDGKPVLKGVTRTYEVAKEWLNDGDYLISKGDKL